MALTEPYCPISLVNFIDENRQWFKAKVGLDVSEMPRSVGLSYLCQEQRNVVVVPDTLADEKLTSNPVVTGYPWQLALHGNNDGIWDWNFKTNEVFFSTQWKEMLGYKDHEVSNCWHEWTKRIHPDERDSVLQAFQHHFAKKTPFYVCEYRVQCQDGSYKWILDRGQALWDALGDVVRMVGSYTDITDRKRADEELKLQNMRSQLFAEITLKIRESLQINEILKTSVTEVQKLLQADHVLKKSEVGSTVL